MFLNQGKSSPDLIQLALESAELESFDFDFTGLTASYDQKDYVCQYSESHFDFVSR